jgi:dephospho-CoA kinase
MGRLKTRGIPILDSDHLAHELLKSGNPVFESVVTHFGEEILALNGDIERSKLGKLVFGDVVARKKLNGLMHPAIGKQWRSWLDQQSAALAIVVIPLLFELGLEKEFDGVVCVWAPESLMKQRLLKRNLTEIEAIQRIRAQIPVDLKAKKANWTLHNNLTLSHLHTQVDEWVDKLINQENN